MPRSMLEIAHPQGYIIVLRKYKFYGHYFVKKMNAKTMAKQAP